MDKKLKSLACRNIMFAFIKEDISTREKSLIFAFGKELRSLYMHELVVREDRICISTRERERNL